MSHQQRFWKLNCLYHFSSYLFIIYQTVGILHLILYSSEKNIDFPVNFV